MKNITINIIIVTFIFLSCNATETKIQSDSVLSSNNTIIHQDKLVYVSSLKNKKSLIDSSILYQKLPLRIYEKYSDKSNAEVFVPDKIIDEERLDKLQYTYDIFSNNNNQIVAISLFPNINSGDGYISDTYYFDENGKTYAYKKETNFFNSGCTPGAAYETRNIYFDENFKVVDSTYVLVDEQGKALKKDSCNMLYDMPLKLYSSKNEILKAHHLKLD